MSKKKNTLNHKLDTKLTNCRVDFCKNFKWSLVASLLILVAGIVMYITLGFNGTINDGELLTKTFIAMLVALALVLIYFAFRFDITSALAVVLAVFHDVLIMTCLTTIFRLPISSTFIASLLITFAFSIFNNSIILSKIRENVRNGNFLKEKNEVIANASARQSLVRTGTITIFALIVTVVLACAVSGVRWTAVSTLLGLLSAFYSSILVTPALWSIAYREPKNKRKKSIN